MTDYTRTVEGCYVIKLEVMLWHSLNLGFMPKEVRSRLFSQQAVTALKKKKQSEKRG